ncbi:redoxin domain-containing protein [Candidatus Woesearchaeota archaeon]|nr:redoxin domain-containing protein [Candidatus Woesearchaeota archaeon]
MLKIGEKAPSFTAQAFQNEEIKFIKLDDYKGKWVILMFYPGDFTFICPTELYEVASMYDKFKELGAEILGISTDSVHVHKAWHDTSKAVRNVTFPLISDKNGSISRSYHTYLENDGESLRGTFIINPEGILKTIEIHDNSIGRNANELLRRLQAAKFTSENQGQVCPASWTPGKETLKPGLNLVGKI